MEKALAGKPTLYLQCCTKYMRRITIHTWQADVQGELLADFRFANKFTDFNPNSIFTEKFADPYMVASAH